MKQAWSAFLMIKSAEKLCPLVHKISETHSVLLLNK